MNLHASENAENPPGPGIAECFRRKMTEYIATFYSHFGAMRFQKELKAQGIQARMMPVPRSLSSSCGTAVLFQAEKGQIPGNRHRELEQIVQVLPGELFEAVYRAEDS
jgi:hypothetical protein